MEGSNYSEMLEKLNSDRSQTLIKLAAIDMAIEGVTQLQNVNLGHNPAILSNNYPLNNINKEDKKSPYDEYIIEISDVYHQDMQPIEKLIYAIFKKNGTFAQEAASYIYEIDKSLDLGYLKNRFTDIASGLGRAKKLDIKKIGKKFKYSIPQRILNNYYEEIL